LAESNGDQAWIETPQNRRKSPKHAAARLPDYRVKTLLLRRDDGLIRGDEEFSRNKREQSLKLTESVSTRGKGKGRRISDGGGVSAVL